MIQEVMFCRHYRKFQTKKTLKCHLEFNFNNFQERNMEFFNVDCYDILTIGLDIIRFGINITSELVFIIILYFFLLHIHLEGGYLSFFICNFFHELLTQSITIKRRPTN